MLTRLDSLLASPLRAALGASVPVLVDDGARPPAQAGACVTLLATELARVPAPDGGDDAAARETAFATRTVDLQADASDPRRFALPPDAVGVVAEVQSPPGRLLPQGDAWEANAGSLRLLRAPTAAVRVTLRGPAVRGHQERWAARVALRLVAWAPGADAASDLLGRALSSVFGTLADLDLVDLLDAAPGGGLSLRLLRPVVQLQGVQRGIDATAGAAWHRLAAQLLVQGDLVQHLALGAPEPASTIRRIELGLDHLRADGTPAHGAATVGATGEAPDGG